MRGRPNSGQWATVACEHCGLVLRPNNLPRHLRSQHTDDPRTRSIVPLEEQQRIVELYQRNWTLGEISADVLWSASTCNRVRQLWGVPKHRRLSRGGRKVSIDDVLHTTELYGQGQTVRAIAAVLGVHPETVRSRLVREGVKRRPRGPVPRAPRRRKKAKT